MTLETGAGGEPSLEPDAPAEPAPAAVEPAPAAVRARAGRGGAQADPGIRR